MRVQLLAATWLGDISKALQDKRLLALRGAPIPLRRAAMRQLGTTL